jgi:4'-phosphopantetheinyl transferase
MISSQRKKITWSGFRLANVKVHIWQASLEQPLEVVQKLETLLSEEERERAGRFRYQEHRQSFIVSRGILRNLLYRYTGILPDQIQFKYNVAGKPYLADLEPISDLSFNLSHAGLLALYAFSWGRQVGIDVENIHPMEEMDQVARRTFSSREYERFQKLSEGDRLRAFYNCWTRKEAFVKAIGDGLSFPLKELEVTFTPGKPAGIINLHGSPEHAEHWSIYDLKTWDGYAAALVVEGQDHSLTHKQWTYTQNL